MQITDEHAHDVMANLRALEIAINGLPAGPEREAVVANVNGFRSAVKAAFDASQPDAVEDAPAPKLNIKKRSVSVES